MGTRPMAYDYSIDRPEALFGSDLHMRHNTLVFMVTYR